MMRGPIDKDALVAQPRVLTLDRFNLRLARVIHDDIEEIRQGRNLEHVRSQHLYQKEIQPDEQERWFAAINNKYNYIFVIQKNEQNLGVVYVKDFTERMATSTCGVFMWDKSALASPIPILAIITLFDFFFGDLRGGSTQSFVLKSNQAAAKMNRFFGFHFEDVENQDYCRISMDLERYLGERQRLVNFAKRVVKTKETHDLVVGGEDSPLNFEEVNAWLRQHVTLHPHRSAAATPPQASSNSLA